MDGPLTMQLATEMSQELAGFHTNLEQPDPSPGPPRTPATAWISDQLLDHTRRVWSKAYGRVISAEEAVEILMNVRRLAEVILKVEKRRSGL